MSTSDAAEVVPGEDGHEHGDRDDPRPRERDDDPEQDLEAAGAVDPRGVDEVLRDRPEVAGEDHRRERDVGDDVDQREPGQAVDEPEARKIENSGTMRTSVGMISGARTSDEQHRSAGRSQARQRVAPR